MNLTTTIHNMIPVICPPAVAELLLCCGLDLVDVGDDWLDVMGMFGDLAKNFTEVSV